MHHVLYLPAKPQDPWFGLPADWDAVRDKAGGWQYYNKRTRDVVLKRPAAAEGDDASTRTGSSA